MPYERRKLKIGIAYSGGISKCAYQLGFTKTLLKYVDKSEIKGVSGASMGFFTGYALSAGKLDKLEWAYRQIDVEKPWQLAYRVLVKGLFADTLNGFVHLGDRLEIPVCFPVCYVPLFSTRYYWLLGEYNPVWKKYVNAATNFPSLRLLPVIHKGRFAFDGGAVDNIPIFPLLNCMRPFGEENLDLLIVLHFDARYDYRKYFSTEIPVLDIDVSIANGFKKNHFDFSLSYIEEMIASAESYADGICSALFTGDCSREGLKKKTDEIFLKEHEARQKNSSLDGWVSVMNAIGRTFRTGTNCYRKLF